MSASKPSIRRASRSLGGVAAAVALAALAAACGGAGDGVGTSAPESSAPESSAPEGSAPEGSAPESSSAETSSAETTTPETAALGPRLDAAVLAGAATTIGGESFDLGTLAGKDLVVWFWAPW